MTRRTILLLTFCVIGCGGGRSADAEAVPGSRARLVEVGQLIRLYQQDNNRPPGKLADVQKYATGFPLGVQALTRGEIVVVWGVGVTPDQNGDKILAHGKDAAAEGGWVLMQNGEVKALKPDQFAAAPKAVK